MSQDLPPSSKPAIPEPPDPSETPSESAIEVSSELSEATEIPSEVIIEVPAEPSEPVETPSDAAIVTSPPIDPPPVASPEAVVPSVQSSVKRSHQTAPEDDEILPQTVLRLLGEAIVAAQPVIKRQSIKALRGTIQLLEGAVERLEAEPTPKQRRRAPAPGTASENVLPPTSKTDTGELAPPPSTNARQAKFRTWQQIQRQWRQVLRQIRDRLPASINRLSDRALTGAIAGIFVIVLWTTSVLLPDQPKPTSIAKAPPSETVTPAPTPTPVSTPVPPIVQAPEPPKPVEISPAPLKPSLPPPLKLTPEQKLIARIQDQVADISNQYASGLIQSVQANFRSSRLIVNISDGWYSLGRSQQDKLANEILRRTQDLNFIKLELVDEAGKLLARSPVVGSEMILLKRTNALIEAA